MEYKDSVIFFLDILGFKEIINKNKLTVDEIIKIFDITELNLNYEGYMIERKHDDSKWILDRKNKLKYLQVSDSIIISFPIDTPSGLYNTIFDIMVLQGILFIKYGVLLRGGCTFGELYHEGTTIFGKAMNNVVIMEEIAKFPRVIIPRKVIDECSNYHSESLSKNTEKGYILNCLSKDKDEYYYINYIYYSMLPREGQDDKKIFEFIKKLRDKIVKNINKEDAIEKYIWLKEKYNESLKSIYSSEHNGKDIIGTYSIM